MSESITTQTIAPISLEAAAAAALGGPPLRPPALQTRPIAVPQGDAAARAAHEAAARQAQGADMPEAPLGHPTFDEPPGLAARRTQVRQLRGRLAALARQILAEEAALKPILADLADDAADIRQAETFDCTVAAAFLADLKSVVEGLSAAKPTTPQAASK